MCKECGCGVVGEVGIHPGPGAGDAPQSAVGQSHDPAPDHAHEHGSGHDHPHPHEHDHQHEQEHSHPHVTGHQTIDVQQAILSKNDRLAERNRGFFRAKGLLVLNVVSAPGSGKTAFIRKTAELLRGRLRIGVVVGDLATENDANRLREIGVPAVQITTGNACHLEAEMVARAVANLKLDQLDLLVIENVGNLVCPAVYDLGEDLRVVLLSATEGEDKPLKYPPMFHSAHVVVVNKIDLSAASDFNRELALANIRRVSHHAEHVFEVSAKTGQGMEAWCGFLEKRRGRPGR